VHFRHEGDSGEVLAKTIVQILTDASLFSRADVEQSSLQLLALCDVDAAHTEKCAAEWGFAKAITNWRELLSDPAMTTSGEGGAAGAGGAGAGV